MPFAPDDIVSNAQGDGNAAVPSVSEEALEASESKYRALFEGAGDAIFLLENGGYIEWNSVALKMFRCVDWDFTGSSPERFSPHLQPDGEPSDQRARYFIKKAWEMGTQHFEWLHLRRDNTTFPAEVNLTRIPSLEGEFVLAIVRDISERKQAEEALRASEARYRTFFENSCDPMVMLRGDQFIDCNDAMVRVLGYEYRAQLLNTHPVDTSPDYQPNGMTSREQARDMIDTVHSQGTHLFEWEHISKDGKPVPVEIAMTALPSPEGPLLLAVLRDISVRKQAEKDREELETQLRQSQKMDAIGQLAGGVAHDLNNLLQAITGYSELTMLEVSPESPVRTNLSQVLKASGSATNLVRQLLAFSRRQTLTLEELDLNEVIDDFSKMIRRLIGEHIEFSTLYKPGRMTIKADKSQIEQVLMNLCVNARDAMEEGGTLKVTTGIEEVDEAFCEMYSCAMPGRHVLLSVRDTGKGIDKAIREHIFEPFYTTKELGKGTGLGLSTVYGIIKQHNGYIVVESEPGRGAEFKVYLPFCEERATAVEKQERRPPPTGSEVILLAEDDSDVRRLAERFLEAGGYTVLPAADGAEASELFDVHAASIGLAILDVMMPGKSGREVAEHIRNGNKEIPILFVSGYSAGTIHSEYIEKHGFNLLLKPYGFEQILKTVRQILDQ